MPPNSRHAEFVDLSSDDEPDPSANLARAARLNASQLSLNPPAEKVEYAPARVHGGYNLDTLEWEQHPIPDDQLSCSPGCPLAPVEFDENGNQIPPEVAEARRDEILVARFRARKAREDAEKNGAKSTDITNLATPATCSSPARGQAVDAPPSHSGRARPRTNNPAPSFIIDLDSPNNPSAGSRTEPGSANDDDPLTTSASVSSTSKVKGKAREQDKEPVPEIDLSLLDSSDEEDLRRAIALSLEDNQALDDPVKATSSSNSNTKRRRLNGQAADQVTTVDTTIADNGNDTRKTEAPGPSHSMPGNKPVAPAPPSLSQTQAQAQARGPSAMSSGETNVTTTTTSTNPESSFNLAVLNRKQMEAERLARLKRKHQAEAEEGHSADSYKAPEVEHHASGPRSLGTISPPPLRHPTESGRNPRQKQFPTSASGTGYDQNNTNVHASGSKVTGNKNIYPHGVALKTRIAGDEAANTIDFATLIAPASSLESCLLSSFIWNFDWLFPHFETKRTKFQLVMHAKNPDQREALKSDFQGVPNVRICFPRMDGNINCMHSKLMLLFYKDPDSQGNGNENLGSVGSWREGARCRIVVPTANLVDFDWGVGGYMENTVWLIDLPLKPKYPRTSAMLIPTEFQRALTAFLKAQSVPHDVIQKLEQFDFTRTAKLGFVHSIGGMHAGGEYDNWKYTGVCGLAQTITQLGLASPQREPIELDYVTSSLGSLTDEFMSSMYLAAQGDAGLAEYQRRTGQNGSSGTRMEVVPQRAGTDHRDPDDKANHFWREKMRVYYPSDETVRRSRGGPGHAGTICFSSKWWHNGKFPKSNIRDCVSVRQGLLMHNKLMFARYAAPVEHGGCARLGWAYVGSANLSESAWGRLVQDKTTKQPKLNCRNWECGVIIPLEAEDAIPSNRTDVQSDAGLATFERLVPVPMRYPGAKLEGKKPWTMFD